MSDKAAGCLHVRGFTSLLTALSFVIMTISGIVRLIVPQGRIANWHDWRFPALTKSQWGDMYIGTRLLFILAGLWHTWINWRAARVLPPSSTQDTAVQAGIRNRRAGYRLLQRWRRIPDTVCQRCAYPQQRDQTVVDTRSAGRTDRQSWRSHAAFHVLAESGYRAG